VNYTRNWLFLVGISLMSRELSRVVFAFSRHSFICNPQYERNISWHSILAAMQNKLVVDMAPGEADRLIRQTEINSYSLIHSKFCFTKRKLVCRSHNLATLSELPVFSYWETETEHTFEGFQRASLRFNSQTTITKTLQSCFLLCFPRLKTPDASLM
jgi:hypothetical protein